MTRARKELVADWCRSARRPPIGVYGPTMKTSSRPMTSGGSSRLHSTPVSHTRGNGSFPRASIQARGVQTRNSTPRVTRPDSTEISSGSNAPLAVRELTMALQDRWASKAITGPSKASQIMPAPTTETRVDAERSRSDPPVIRPDPAGRRGPEESSPWTAPPAAAAGAAAPLTRNSRGNGACRPGHRRGDQGEPARLVLGQARRRQCVLDERGRGRGGLADDGDVDYLRRAGLGLAVVERDRRLGVRRGASLAAEVDGGRKRDVVQVQLDRLGNEGA